MEIQMSIKFTEEFMAQIDREIERSGFASRSEFVKCAIREYLLRHAEIRNSDLQRTAAEDISRQTPSERI